MSRGVGALVVHSLRRIRWMLLGLAVLLGGFQFLLTQVASYMLRRSAFGQLSSLMPDFMRSVLGPQTLAFMSFGGIVAFGYFHPMVISAALALAISIGTEPAGEIETRFVDLTLARELTRLDVAVRSVIVFTIAGAFVLGLMMFGTWTGLTCCTPADAPRPTARLVLSLAISLGTLMVCWGGIAFAVAAASRRRAVAAGITGVAALAAYLLDYLGRAWEPARAIGSLTPFHFFDPVTLITGASLSMRNVAALVALGLIGTTVGALIFSRRDI
jgi:ABC-2 type transport system permease protein